MKNKRASLAIASLLIGPGLSHAEYRQIQAGDTLSQIAETNYGNWVKWHDLWEVNKENIPNPDLIFPGQRLRLLNDVELARFAQNNAGVAGVSGMPGSDEESASDAETGTVRQPKRGLHSQEWRLLPVQSWEKYVFKTSKQIDPDGFDRRSLVTTRMADKSTSTITIASDRIPILGEVTEARSEYQRLFLGDQIFIRADEQLQVGSTYSVTTGPQKIVSKRDGRVGFGYDLTGKIRIVGVRDGLFIGTITAIYYPIRRHNLLIPEVKDLYFPQAIPAANALPASIVVPNGANDEMLGEQKIVYLDVGNQDGVKPGMIFRHYLHTDPYTGDTITAKDFLIEAELQVLSVQDKFSVAIILSSHTSIHFGDELVALTDLTDFQKNQGMQSVIQDTKKSTSVDDLDNMDNSDGLGEKENKDLRQLEKWSNPTPNDGNGVGVSDDEIMRMDTHDHPNRTFEIGKEPAPNDKTTNGKPETAPEPSVVPPAKPDTPPPTLDSPPPATLDAPPPATNEAPPPATEVPPPANEATPMKANDAQLDGPPAAIESSAPPPSGPAPIDDKANGTPSGSDPFTSPQAPPPPQ